MHRNELADWLAKSIEQAKPYSKLITLFGLLVVLAGAAAVWWTQQSAAREAQAWAGFDRALSGGTPAELEQIANQNAGTEVAHWAAVSAGDMYLADGCQQLFTNKSTASAALREAVRHYRVVQEESRVPALLERASFGLARAYEALAGTRQSQGELDKAIEAYKQVVDKWPNGAYGELAARRLEDLSLQETKAFYDKFAQFDPRPALPDVAGAPGDRPSFDLDSLSDGGPLFGQPEPTGTDDAEADQPPAKDDSSGPVDPEANDSPEPEASPEQGQAAPDEETTVEGQAESEGAR